MFQLREAFPQVGDKVCRLRIGVRFVPYSIKSALPLKAKVLNKDLVLAFNSGMGGISAPS
jgi:hypothetical protein